MATWKASAKYSGAVVATVGDSRLYVRQRLAAESRMLEASAAPWRVRKWRLRRSRGVGDERR